MSETLSPRFLLLRCFYPGTSQIQSLIFEQIQMLKMYINFLKKKRNIFSTLYIELAPWYSFCEITLVHQAPQIYFYLLKITKRVSFHPF